MSVRGEVCTQRWSTFFFYSRGEFVRFCGPTAQLYRGRAPASTGQKEPFQGKSHRQHGGGEHSSRRTVILVPPEQLLWSLSHTVAWGMGGLPRIGLRALTRSPGELTHGVLKMEALGSSWA